VAVDEPPHLDKPHGIVHVGQGQRRVRPVVRQELHDDDEPCEAQEKGEAPKSGALKGDVRHRRALGQGITCEERQRTELTDRALAAAACVSINSARTLPPCGRRHIDIKRVGIERVGVKMRRAAGMVL
jgi:hypothetical protein